MHRANRGATLVHRTQHAGILSAAGVQHNFSLQLLGTHSRQIPATSAIAPSGVAIKIIVEATMRRGIPA
jgi:hypothetical protein